MNTAVLTDWNIERMFIPDFEVSPYGFMGLAKFQRYYVDMHIVKITAFFP